MMSLQQKLSTDALLIGFVNILQRARGVVFIPLLTSSLGIGGYGAFVQLIAVTGFASSISSLKLESAIVKFGQMNKTNESKLYITLAGMSLLTSSIAAVCISGLAQEIARLTLGDTGFAFLFALGGWLIPFEVMVRVSSGFYRAKMRTKIASVITGVNRYVQLVAIATVVYLGGDLKQVTIAFVGATAGFAVLMQIIVSRSVRPVWPSIDGLKSYLRYSVPLTGAVVASNTSTRADRFLIGAFLGPTAVGVYAIAYAISGSLSTLVSPIQAAFFPEFSRLLSEDRYEEVSRYVTSGIRYFLTLGIPAVAGLAIIGEDIAQLLASNSVSVETNMLVTLIGAGILLFGLDQLYGVVLIAEGQTNGISAARATAALMNIGLNVILIPRFGISGAAFATTVTYSLSATIVYVLSNKIVRTDVSLWTIGKIFLATFLMAFLIAILVPNNVIFSLLLGITLYFSFLYLLGGIEVREVRELIS